MSYVRFTIILKDVLLDIGYKVDAVAEEFEKTTFPAPRSQINVIESNVISVKAATTDKPETPNMERLDTSI